MPTRIKRGLGLLLLGIPLWVVGLAFVQNDGPDGEVGAAIYGIGGGLIGLAGVVCVLVGLGMIIWTLLRD